MTETDSEFEAFLKRRTVLPNGMSDDDKVEPPKALDAIVLKKAREAIRAQQRVDRAPRWATPVALAATILLCLSIVLNVRLNTNRPTANLQRMTAATADKASPTPAAPASGNERREGAAEGTISQDAPSRSAAARATPTPSVMASAAPPPPAPASAMPSGSAGEPADQFTSVTVTGARRSRADARTAASSPSTSVTTPPATATAAQPAAAATPPADSMAAASGLEEAVLAEPKAAADPHPKDPKAWLRQIAALRAAGKSAQAEAEMQRFRAIFPAYPVKPGPSTPSEPSPSEPWK